MKNEQPKFFNSQESKLIAKQICDQNSSQLWKASYLRAFVLLVVAIFVPTLLALAQPTAQDKDIVISPISATATTSLRFDFTNGTGGVGHIVILKNSTGVYKPVNGAVSPSANTAFPADGAGTDLDPAGGGIAACVLNGAGTSVTVTGLTADAIYTVQVYEYSGSSANPTYSFAGSTNNPVTFQTFSTVGNTAFPVASLTAAGVKKVTVQAWGGGGGGGNGGANGGGGGGGGAYSVSLATLAGAPMNVAVGGGVSANTDGNDSWFGTSTLVASAIVLGKKGLKGPNTSTGAGGAGGLASANLPANAGFNGGSGGSASSSAGAGGGSSAGTGSVGGNGSNGGGGSACGAAGTAPTGAGAGGEGGGSCHTDGNTGNFPGGGGGGANDGGSDVGGTGAQGLVIISYTLPTAVITINDADGIVKAGDILTITATFSEPIQDAPPAMQMALSGANTLAATNMVKSSSTVYTYAHTVGAGNGTVTIALSNGISSATTNVIASSPLNGGTFTVDNTPPAFSSTAPLSNAFINTTAVSYTLSEAIVSGTIVYTKTTGSDTNSPTRTIFQVRS